MVVAASALFVGLGGSSYAALSSAARSGCSSASKLKGSALISGSSSFSGSFIKVSGFNCSGKAIKAKRTGVGKYEVKFVSNPDKLALGNLVDPNGGEHDDAFITFSRVGPGDFQALIYNAVLGGSSIGNQDRPFSIVLP
jgi:hypothetical protein